MTKNNKYTISSSYISIITGDNIYQKKRDFLLQFWKKTNSDDFKTYCEITNFKIKSDFDKIDEISKKNNINVQNELTKCIKSKNIEDLTKKKEEILERVKDLSENDQKKIKDSILNISNTYFGIKNETDVLTIYKKSTNTRVIKDDKYKTKQIYSNDEYTIFIGGKIDGINIDDGSIIEIKNRTKKLFYELRSYEKVQLMCYLYLFQSNKGYLVESLKKEDGIDINIIECLYDDEYMNIILLEIKNFIKYYRIFIINHKMKLSLIQNENDIDFSI